jgi:hypothetical protein
MRYYPLTLPRHATSEYWPDQLDCRRLVLTRQREELFALTGGQHPGFL